MSRAYCNFHDLTRLRLIARQLSIFQSKRIFSHFIGTVASPFKGRGMDFEEVRIYQPGDDIRSIDWRVTARRSKPHTKIFKEERERSIIILVDQSQHLFFGSQFNFKSVTIAEVASLISWAALHHGDKIGGIVFNDHKLYEVRSKRSKENLMHFLKKIEKLNNQLSVNYSTQPAQENIFIKAIRHLRAVAHPGTQIFLISDFQNYSQAAYHHLYQLHKHCEIVALHISDPMEYELPKPNQYDISNGVNQIKIDTSQSEFRQSYQDSFNKQYQQLKENLTPLRIPIIRLSSHLETSTQMLTVFNKPAKIYCKKTIS